MKAAQLIKIGEPLSYTDCEAPDINPDQALVRLNAAAINHRDIWISKGQYANIQTPCILGSDGAGVVEKVGAYVSEDWLHKEVIINPNRNWGQNERYQEKSYGILGMPSNGTFARYVAVSADRLHEKPNYLSFEEAAALPLGGLTAYRSLFTRGRLQKGEKVLINGVGGGVAQLAFQFALAAGAEVFVTSGSKEKRQMAIQKGAKGALSYKTEKWGKLFLKEYGSVDLVIDSAGGDGFAQFLYVLKPGGRVVLYGGTKGAIQNLSPQIVFWKQLDIMGSTMGSDQDFEDMVAFVRQHEIVPQVCKTFELEEVNEAFSFIEAQKQFGKVVLVT